jgi:ABC-type multidrug transport system fused ATPase/permease subunit
MLLGTIGAVLHGVAFPISMNIFGDIANAFVDHDASRGIIQQSIAPCPGFNATSLTRNSPFIGDFSTLVGGNESVVDCAGVFTFVNPLIPGSTCAEFTLQEVLQDTVNAQITCLDNGLFIDEVNRQIFIFLGVAFGALLVAIAEVWFFQTAAERQVHRIRLCYYKSILRQDIAWFDTNPTGEVASRLSKLVPILCQIG